MAEVKLRADKRTATGSAASRRLRRAGNVPATVYGLDIEPVSVSVDARQLHAALHTDAGLNAIIALEVNGASYTTLAREIQRHPVRGDIIHLDFLQVSLTETVTAEVALELEGTPVGVRDEGGIVETIRAVVVVEALPTDIPSSIAIDISGLGIGDVVRIEDLPSLPGVEYVDEPDTGLATVTVPRAVVEEEPEVPEELLEGEEIEEGVAEGEEAAAEAGGEAEGEDEGS